MNLVDAFETWFKTVMKDIAVIKMKTTNNMK